MFLESGCAKGMLQKQVLHGETPGMETSQSGTGTNQPPFRPLPQLFRCQGLRAQGSGLRIRGLRLKILGSRLEGYYEEVGFIWVDLEVF